MRGVTWLDEAASLRGIPPMEAFTPDLMVYPRPTRWGRCQGCGSTVWSLGQSPNEAADVFAVHVAFCEARKAA